MKENSKKQRHLRTSDLARVVGVHVNTIRLYEAWGFLSPVPRAANGYRRFSPVHLDQVRLVRLALGFTWLGGDTRKQALRMIKESAAGDFRAALERGEELRNRIKNEQTRAEEAVELLDRWAQGEGTAGAVAKGLSISRAAEHLGVTTDALRTWERNGLLKVPQNPRNRYRVYGPVEINRLQVIRTLRSARYSLMAILRMMIRLDGREKGNLRQVLDSPGPREDALYATDRWLSTLAELEQKADETVAHLKTMVNKFIIAAG